MHGVRVAITVLIYLDLNLASVTAAHEGNSESPSLLVSGDMAISWPLEPSSRSTERFQDPFPSFHTSFISSLPKLALIKAGTRRKYTWLSHLPRMHSTSSLYFHILRSYGFYRRHHERKQFRSPASLQLVNSVLALTKALPLIDVQPAGIKQKMSSEFSPQSVSPDPVGTMVSDAVRRVGSHRTCSNTRHLSPVLTAFVEPQELMMADSTPDTLQITTQSAPRRRPFHSPSSRSAARRYRRRTGRRRIRYRTAAELRRCTGTNPCRYIQRGHCHRVCDENSNSVVMCRRRRPDISCYLIN